MPSCRKYITIENMLFNMTGSIRMEASWANDNKDIIMAQLTWSERGSELVHPGLLRPHVLMGIVGLRDERDFMKDLSSDNQADVIKAFNSTSRYLDDLLNSDNPYFDGMVNQIYPSELQLNKANTSDTEAPFLDLHLSISNGFVSSKIYDKRDDFDFDIVNFPFLDGDVPRRPSYGVYISQLIRFARVCSHVDDLNTRNKCLTAKLLKQGYRYHKLRKAFSKFYRRHYELISKFNVGLKSLLHQGLSEPEFYGDLVYKFKKIRGMTDFSDQFRKIIMRYKRIGYNLNVMQQSACLVINPITVDGYAALFNCTPVDRASDSMMAPT